MGSNVAPLLRCLSWQQDGVFARGGYAFSHLYELECVVGTGSRRFA